jgi:ribosome-associated protein
VRESELTGLIWELVSFRFSRSAGHGGQNVNKVNTKVTASLAVDACGFLSEVEKERVREKLARRINKGGELVVRVQDERSQFANRQKAVARFSRLIIAALEVEKERRKTKPTKAGREKRLRVKKAVSVKKSRRRIEPADE